MLSKFTESGTFIVIQVFVLLTAISCHKNITRVSQNSIPSQVFLFRPIVIPNDSLHPVFEGLSQPENVYQYYKTRAFKPVWIDSGSYLVRDSILLFLSSVRFY